MSDPRYTIALEYCGYSEPRHVLRFCGERLGRYESHDDAVLAAAEHASARLGLLPVQAGRRA